MFNPFKMPQKEVDFAHEFARVIQQRLLVAIGLGCVSVITTAISASWGYYARELPQSIRALNQSVDGLRGIVQEIQQTNEKQEYIQDNFDRRLNRIEESLNAR